MRNLTARERAKSKADEWLVGEIIITRHGKPAGLLIGFRSEDDWFEYRLEKDARFLKRIAAARRSLAAGKGKRLEELSG